MKNSENYQASERKSSQSPSIKDKELHLTNAGSMGFDPKLVDFPGLKEWVRSRTIDDEIRKFGSLRKRATWEAAAQGLMF